MVVPIVVVALAIDDMQAMLSKNASGKTNKIADLILLHAQQKVFVFFFGIRVYVAIDQHIIFFVNP